MPSIAVAIDGLALGPGWLYWAPLGSSAPTNTVVGSRFTDTWPVAWLPIGATDEGSEWTYETDTDDVEIAESLDPVAVVATGRTIGLSFAMVNINTTNLKRAMNGGTITTTGSDATTLNEFTPPELGQEVRAMIGWESQDSTERLVGYQVFQTGEISIERRKGADKAMIPVEWRFEKPVTGPPFRYWTAGTVRG
ncbi:hypothetical protein ACFVH6_21870 [Spirillospora sp. NPDC127200]